MSIQNESKKKKKKKKKKVPLYAATVREAYKCAKYEDEIDQEGGDFVPFVLQTFGAMTRTVEHMAELIEDAAINNCVPQPPTKQQVLNELAVQLQRGVVLALIKALAAARQPLGPWMM